MKILIDTNIILDFLLARAPFFENAKKLMQLVDDNKTKAYITANSITDIVYIVRKTYTIDEIRTAILALLDRIDVIGVDREDILLAFGLGFSDFEDALQSACSQKEQVECIVTRNKKDFEQSNVTTVDISDFLAEYAV